jgi:hypothetical protein
MKKDMDTNLDTWKPQKFWGAKMELLLEENIFYAKKMSIIS